MLVNAWASHVLLTDDGWKLTAQTLGIDTERSTHCIDVSLDSEGLPSLQVWPKQLDICFFITYGVTLILSYTIPALFVQHWLQVGALLSHHLCSS